MHVIDGGVLQTKFYGMYITYDTAATVTRAIIPASISHASDLLFRLDLNAKLVGQP